jgi:L-threonylcarbamoyladenylate synthase
MRKEVERALDASLREFEGLYSRLANESEMHAAVRLLVAGELVALPTETVYGLGADAANPEAVAKIFALKGRPADHPLIVHLAKDARLDDWAIDIPDAARRLAAKFWPGPLTLILKKSARIPAIVTGGQDSVGLRCPAHPLALELLEEFAKAGSGIIAAPSANKFGHVSPTTAAHVQSEFGPELMVLDGGPCPVGIESTILDLSRGMPVLLRPGAVTREQIAEVIGQTPRSADAAAPRASGTLESHYAPRTPLRLVDEADPSPASAVLAQRAPPAGMVASDWIAAPLDPAGYAHDLYANLRTLDASGAVEILVEKPPVAPEWDGVNDRLMRAAAGAVEDDET